MNKQQIKMVARRLLNGEHVNIDGILYKVELRHDGVRRMSCEDCDLNCLYFSDIGNVCCELEMSTSKPYRLVPICCSK